MPVVQTVVKPEATCLRELTAAQWKSGIAAWLGWLFDGLDMHLYTLVAAPFVAQLLSIADPANELVRSRSSWIQAAFLVGWALGGGFFGRLGDRLGRSAALSLTIFTYAIFTGLSSCAATWWQLLIFRFLTALGIGGEWAVGSALLAETWPRKWRPWIAAVLQTGVNIGVLLACLTNALMSRTNPRYIFLVGILPALLVLWVRRAVPEPEEWKVAKKQAAGPAPGIADLFRGAVRRTTILTILLCSLSLTAWWAFMFWNLQHVSNLPQFAGAAASALAVKRSFVFSLVIVVSIGGNFFGGFLAKLMGYRRGIALMFLGFLISFIGAYGVPRRYETLLPWVCSVGFFSGVFGLFTMYLPPLFPTLLRTTGAGFCFNVGRVVAAFGTVFFGCFSKVGDFRVALLYDGMLFAPAILLMLFMPEPPAMPSAQTARTLAMEP
jgi:MFS family permease